MEYESSVSQISQVILYASLYCSHFAANYRKHLGIMNHTEQVLTKATDFFVTEKGVQGYTKSLVFVSLTLSIN